MSYLLGNYSENIAARITDNGRRKIAQGNFNVSYFQIGDSEYDYAFSELTQKVFIPLDKDSQVKYPYKVSVSTLTGTTFGTPVQSSYVDTVQNTMGPAGFVSSGSEIISSPIVEIDILAINGTSQLVVPSGPAFTSTTYISLLFTKLGAADTITGETTSLVYKITGITSNTLWLDRKMPDLSSLSPRTVNVISNENYSGVIGSISQQDSWTLNTIWSRKPAGLDSAVDENLSGYTSNVFVSTKEYLGYNSSTGQTANTGTTITNSFGENVLILPEEQHSLTLLRYPRDVDAHDLGFKYEDYIDHTIDGVEEFEVYIPFIYYDRNTGTTIGARFFMDTTDYYINSSASDTRNNQMKYRYLIDEQGYHVGKVFVNNKVIVFDDQEIVAALDYKSNRRYTLPIPRISSVPVDSQCDILGDPEFPLLSGGTTVFVSYLLSGSTSTGMHCNHYSKIVGGAVNSDVSIAFNDNDFQFMVTGLTSTTQGYSANKFYILAQQVDTSINPNAQPDPTAWHLMDYTSEFTLVGGFINPVDLRGTRFIISNTDYETYVLYDLNTVIEDFPNEPSSRPEFGDEQPFAGSIKLIRATDLEVMRFFINLPSGAFETTQNPSYSSGKSKRITEVALLDSNKDVLVMAKTSSPIVRTGTQVISVKIDL
jgi:hypothetical protein